MYTLYLVTPSPSQNRLDSHNRQMAPSMENDIQHMISGDTGHAATLDCTTIWAQNIH